MIEQDFIIYPPGDIRCQPWASPAQYTVEEFHQWLVQQVPGEIAATLCTPYIVQLHAPYNIDAAVAAHLRDGSVLTAEDEIWFGG